MLVLRRRASSETPLFHIARHRWFRRTAARAFVDVSIKNGPSDLDLLSDDIAYFGHIKQTGVSLRTLTQTGRGMFLDKGTLQGVQGSDEQRMLFQVAMFLHRELPIRLAHRVRDLDAIPPTMQASTRAVRQMYAASFEEIRSAPSPNTPQRERYFAERMQNIYSRHSSVLLMMARSAYALRAKLAEGAVEFADQETIHDFLDSFYMSRIGIRMLIGQYLALREEHAPGYVGLISQYTSPAEIAKAAVEDAQFMCRRAYGDAPEVTMHGRLDLTFAYVPSHLHYILLELLKNSMRATVEFHTKRQGGGSLDEPEPERELPPVRVVIADGEANEDVVIKVSDEGGGIRRTNMPRIWSYLFTTADPEVQEVSVGSGEALNGGSGSDFGTGSPLAGLGYGLPISRAYARYFGGDLSMMSMEGYGTDAFVYLSRLGDHDEPLP